MRKQRERQYATDKSTSAGRIVSEAKLMGCPVDDLLALERGHDPFYADHPTHVEDAQWFAKIWKKYGGPGKHLRGVHYRIQSLKTVKRPDGRIYQNTVNDWAYLCVAAQRARYNGLVESSDLVDRRNKAAEVVHEEHEIQSAWSVDFYFWDKMLEPLEVHDPAAEIEGYDYEHSDQKYMIEIWIEKTGMSDHLLALQREFGFNLVQGAGFESMTRVDEFIERTVRIDKPVRIFYISDLDVNGVKMPVSVSRQIEYWNTKRGLGLDVKVNHLLLTRDQADEYELPTAPIRMKESYTKKGRAIQQGKADTFEARHGKGTVELDALEGIHPGEFDRIVREAIEPYFDVDLKDNLERAKDEAETALSEAMDVLMEKHQEEIEEVEKEINEASQAGRGKLKAIIDTLKEEIEEAKGTLALPERPVPDADGSDEDDWLFDSERDYDEQLDHYHRANPVVGSER
jgi:hypothetical protein